MKHNLYLLSLEINEFTVYDDFFSLVDFRWTRLAQIIRPSIPILIFGLGPVWLGPFYLDLLPGKSGLVPPLSLVGFPVRSRICFIHLALPEDWAVSLATLSFGSTKLCTCPGYLFWLWRELVWFHG